MGTPYADFDRWDREQQAREDYDIALWDYCTAERINEAIRYKLGQGEITIFDVFRLATQGVCCGKRLQRSTAADDPDESAFVNKMAEMFDDEMVRRFDIYRKTP